MSDLAEWEYVDDFSVYEAACLIQGRDPSAVDTQDQVTAFIMHRLETAYAKALEHITHEVYGPPDGDDDDEIPRSGLTFAPGPLHEHLCSLALEVRKYNCEHGDEVDYKKWFDSPLSDVQHQRFSGRALATWLSENGLKSHFAFVRPKNAVFVDAEGNRPASVDFGQHSTLLLRQLSDACNRFWGLYDPADRTTAPTNGNVVEWLKQQGVSDRIAEAMATILRKEDAPLGRR